jgi:hypothetical protein
MRIAKTLDDLPLGTPIEVDGAYARYKGFVYKEGNSGDEKYVSVIFADGQDLRYYEEDLKNEEILIVEKR